MHAGGERKILSMLAMLAMLAVEVAAGRRASAEFRDEMTSDFASDGTSANFNRVERRLDRIESRLTEVGERRA